MKPTLRTYFQAMFDGLRNIWSTTEMLLVWKIITWPIAFGAGVVLLVTEEFGSTDDQFGRAPSWVSCLLGLLNLTTMAWYVHDTGKEALDNLTFFWMAGGLVWALLLILLAAAVIILGTVFVVWPLRATRWVRGRAVQIAAE